MKKKCHYSADKPMKNPDLANELLTMEAKDLNTRTMLVEKGELFNTGKDYHPTMKESSP